MFLPYPILQDKRNATNYNYNLTLAAHLESRHAHREALANRPDITVKNKDRECGT
jgi:hypothetical protein